VKKSDSILQQSSSISSTSGGCSGRYFVIFGLSLNLRGDIFNIFYLIVAQCERICLHELQLESS
jgi:hypothetical protein